jgi:hypothetical protein
LFRAALNPAQDLLKPCKNTDQVRYDLFWSALYKVDRGKKMTNGLNEVIRKLEQQLTGIERALAALREIDGAGVAPATPAGPAKARGRKAKRKGGMTPDGRRRLSEALKARWAVKRAGSAVAPAKAKRKGGMTPEGRKRLSEALRQRWAAKRASAAAPAKRAGRK